MKEFICDKTGIKLLITEEGKITEYGIRVKIRYNNNDYPRIELRRNKIRRNYNVHILLATLYIPNPENKPFVNHIDGDKKNFKLNNLEWCTASENMKHAVRIGLVTNCTLKGENHNTSKHTYKDVLEIKEIYKQGNISMRALAKKYNTSSGFISDVVNNKRRQTC